MTAVDEAASITKTHLSLNVSDVNRSAAFYEAFFGVPAHKRRPGYANFDLSDPPLKFALQEHAHQVGVGSLSHLGLQVATSGQVQEAKARLESSGLVTFDETDTTCCYARQDKVWVHDPDGNAWEVYVLLDDMLDEDDHEDDPHAIRPNWGVPTVQDVSQAVPLKMQRQEKACCS
jgi:catechol 2,3-dioxygenase-like lactoylglutathione lyase family enzyme